MMRYRKPKNCAKWQNVHGRSKKSLWWYWTSILFSLCDTRQKCAFLHQYHYVSCLLFRVKLSPVITRKATLATEMLLKFNAFSAKKKNLFHYVSSFSKWCKRFIRWSWKVYILKMWHMFCLHILFYLAMLVENYDEFIIANRMKKHRKQSWKTSMQNVTISNFHIWTWVCEIFVPITNRVKKNRPPILNTVWFMFWYFSKSAPVNFPDSFSTSNAIPFTMIWS